MGVVDQAVEDGIRQGGIAQGVVPVGHRQRAGHPGRAGLITLIEQFEQVPAAFAIEDGQSPIVEDQDIDPGQGGHEFEEASVGMGDGQLLQQAESALVEGGVALTAGGIGQGAGPISLAYTGGTGDEDVLMTADPVAGKQAPKQGPVQAAGSGTWANAPVTASAANSQTLPVAVNLMLPPSCAGLARRPGRPPGQNPAGTSGVSRDSWYIR